jgi:hypothetical protein
LLTREIQAFLRALYLGKQRGSSKVTLPLIFETS